MAEREESLEYEVEPKLLGSWLAIQQAELMLRHMLEAGTEWPDAAIYLHSCITAMRSITLTMQKALAHEDGFAEWYAQAQEGLDADEEMQYLKEARNHVLKRGALRLMHRYELHYNGGLPIQINGIGPTSESGRTAEKRCRSTGASSRDSSSGPRSASVRLRSCLSLPIVSLVAS